MVALEWDSNQIPRFKVILHGLQIVLTLTMWCLEIAVFTGKDAKVVVNNAWTFSMCFLSIPAWVYLIMAPRFPGARRIAEPKAMLVIDVLFTVLWLSAFATQAAYNTAGHCGAVCNLSKAIVGLGVFNTLLWAGTSFLSAWTLQYYNFHGTLPGYDTHKLLAGGGGGGITNIDPDKAAFSMADDEYERVHMDDHEANSSPYGGSARYGHANPYSAEDYDDPNRYGTLPPRGETLLNADTEYTSGGGMAPGRTPSPYHGGGGSHGHYSDEPAQFPAGNYDRIHPLRE
ncbi:hypothetical protein HIM_09173 [Hirsutella minnesotensis 3608]|uniref:MARVEL domain-containing protein n=1 Tax=Hirsutella minnesotensis 3608 TaxID=1043627 RepID=A0A0F8A397_9HYPO|nr:hypothetical protein HIM_09173 [Hirsutella minnesotensis 3608]